MAASAIRTQHLTKRYGRLLALDRLNLTVPAGQVVGLVGESGSGKSTLARAAVGQVPLDAGPILLDGEPLPTRSFQDLVVACA